MTRAPRTIVRPVLFIVLSSLCVRLYRPRYQGTGHNNAKSGKPREQGKRAQRVARLLGGSARGLLKMPDGELAMTASSPSVCWDDYRARAGWCALRNRLAWSTTS